MDPDGPKTCGSGSPTLQSRFKARLGPGVRCGAESRELCVPEIGGNEPANGGGSGEGEQGGDQVHHSEYQVGVPPFYPHYSLCEIKYFGPTRIIFFDANQDPDLGSRKRRFLSRFFSPDLVNPVHTRKVSSIFLITPGS
jgi:hypothetical protein